MEEINKMGMINIVLSGSFGNNGQTFKAQTSGHAQAIREAINWLSGDILEKAIKQDHRLQLDGAFPDDRFGIPVFEAKLKDGSTTKIMG